MKQLSFLALVGCSVLFTGCTSNDEIVTCPVISAPEEGARSFVRSDTAGQMFDVRLNGLTADCLQHKSGGTVVALTVGLKLDRNLGEGADADVIAVPMMTAIVDDQQTVTSNSVFGYIVGFGKDEKQQYPTVEFEKIVPENARLVLSLKPSY